MSCFLMFSCYHNNIILSCYLENVRYIKNLKNKNVLYPTFRDFRREKIEMGEDRYREGRGERGRRGRKNEKGRGREKEGERGEREGRE